jgi:hypothetical protein
VIVLFPGVAQMPEAFLGIRHCDSLAVVDELDDVETAQDVPVPPHIDGGGICIHAIPDPLRNTQDGILRLGKAVDLVLGNNSRFCPIVPCCAFGSSRLTG